MFLPSSVSSVHLTYLRKDTEPSKQARETRINYNVILKSGSLIIPQHGGKMRIINSCLSPCQSDDCNTDSAYAK